MPYVHLANGEHIKVTQKDLAANHAESGVTTVFRKDGMEHHIVGVYPEEYEHPETEEVQAEKAKQNDAEMQEFRAWKAQQQGAHAIEHDPNNSEVDWNVGSQ